jgi:hypothetical protein
MPSGVRMRVVHTAEDNPYVLELELRIAVAVPGRTTSDYSGSARLRQTGCPAQARRKRRPAAGVTS